MADVTDRNGNPVRSSSGAPVTSTDRQSTRGSRSTENSANIDINSAVATAGQAVSQAISTSVSNVVGSIGGGLGGIVGGLLGGVLGGFSNKNPLEDFASYNYIFTLSCLSDFEANLPNFTYRLFGPRNIVLRSGGKGGGFFGASKYDYYIDDVDITHVISQNQASRQSTAAAFEFKVYEPYSMGMFLEALQNAAWFSGHRNYRDAIFMLSLDFVGYDSNGNSRKAFGSTRHFPVKIIEARFNVTEGGSTYECVAVPYNHQAFSDETQTALTEVQIAGRTVEECLQSGLQSLTSVLNTRLLKNEEAGQVNKSDKFVIMFPNSDGSGAEQMMGIKIPEGGATVSPGEERLEPFEEERKLELYESIGQVLESDGEIPESFDQRLKETLGISIERSAAAEAIRDYAQNEENINDIGKSKLVTSPTEGGECPQGDASLAEMGEMAPGQICRARLQISDSVRTFQFTSATKIQKMIEEVVLASEWGQNITERLENPDPNGMVDWFNIESYVFNMDDGKTVAQTGRKPKIFVYRVAPYKVSASRFASPTKGTPFGSLFNMVPREYNYIYTGENKDILDFDIRFDNAFYIAVGATRGQGSAGSRQRGQQGMTATESEGSTVTNEGNSSGTSSSGNAAVRDVGQTSTGTQGGGGSTENPNLQIARMFNDALLNSPSDLIEVELKIWGDPYYMSDSGIGNYISAPGFNLNVNADGAMEYTRSEVDIRLNFRTPVDYRPDGYMQFGSFGLVPVKSFSGLYQVVQVESNFSGGEFTQNLTLIRRRNQEFNIFDLAATQGGNAVVTEGTEENNIDPNENGST